MSPIAMDENANQSYNSHNLAIDRKKSQEIQGSAASMVSKNNSRKNQFIMQRKTVQIVDSQQTTSRELKSIHHKLRSINQIRKEQEKIKGALNQKKADLSVNHISSQMSELRLGNIEKYHALALTMEKAGSGSVNLKQTQKEKKKGNQAEPGQAATASFKMGAQMPQQRTLKSIIIDSSDYSSDEQRKSASEESIDDE